jgi:hypothetical protein
MNNHTYPECFDDLEDDPLKAPSFHINSNNNKTQISTNSGLLFKDQVLQSFSESHHNTEKEIKNRQNDEGRLNLENKQNDEEENNQGIHNPLEKERISENNKNTKERLFLENTKKSEDQENNQDIQKTLVQERISENKENVEDAFFFQEKDNNHEEEEDPLKYNNMKIDKGEDNGAYTIVYNYIHFIGKNFFLLSKTKRNILFENCMEMDRAYYKKSYNIEINFKNNKKEQKSIFGSFNKSIQGFNSENWKIDILNSIKFKEKRDVVKKKIDLLIDKDGIPPKYRKVIWKFFVGDDLRINKRLFLIYMKIAPKSANSDRQIQQDIDRTFFYFVKNPDFIKLLIEAKLLLHLFTVK